MTKEEIIQDILKGMDGIGGIPSNQEFYAEFDFRLRSALGIESSQPVNSGWVSVEDRLPESPDTYLVVRNNNAIFARFSYGKFMVMPAYIGEETIEMKNITHWMPLPSLP